MPETRYREFYHPDGTVTRTPYEVSDAEIEREQAAPRVLAAYRRLGQIATQAQAAADAQGALTLAQLTTQHRTLCGFVADEARALRRIIEHLAREAAQD